MHWKKLKDGRNAKQLHWKKLQDERKAKRFGGSGSEGLYNKKPARVVEKARQAK